MKAKRTKKIDKNSQNLNDLLVDVETESEKLEGKGGLNGLHNLVKQNVALSKIYAQLIQSINDLDNTTSKYSRILIGLTVVLGFLAAIQIYITLCPGR